MTITRGEVLANRWKWVNFLLTKGRKKAVGVLDAGGGQRCCLGHGAYCLGVEKYLDESTIVYGENGEESYAPKELMEKVGLWTNGGATKDYGFSFTIKNLEFVALDAANDEVSFEKDGIEVTFNASPRDIGKYLQSVIEGGENTPFRPLTDYPE